MKKLLSIMLAMSMTLVFTACSDDSSSSSSNDNQTAQNQNVSNDDTEIKLENLVDGVLTVGTEAKYAPYEFVMLDENGNEVFAGFDMDLAQTIADDMGLELKIVDLPFDSIMLELQSGNLDMAIAGLSPKPEREEVSDFSQIYFSAEQAIVINKADEGVLVDQSSFDGLQMAGQTGSIQADYIAENIDGAVLVNYQDIPEMIFELKLGNVRGAVIEAPVVETLLESNPELMILETFLDEAKPGNVVCVRKGAENLLTSVDETITRILADGTMDTFIADAYTLMEEAID